MGSDKATVNKKTEVELGDAVYVDEAEDKLMVPIDKIAEYLSYEVDYYVDQKWVDLARLPDETPLPEKYDMRDYGRVSPVRDQGRYGTCWAFASLGALETTLLPMEEDIFSVDHMSMCNSYALDVNSGGEHTMSIAYLAAWQGPVLEKDDPYGDGMSDPNLTAEKHLEEALIINGREDETIKSAIFRYGAIETSIYSALEYVDSYSMYYSSEYAAYYYDGDETPNHDVVVVGWDDNFPKENFTIQPEGDGSICYILHYQQIQAQSTKTRYIKLYFQRTPSSPTYTDPFLFNTVNTVFISILISKLILKFIIYSLSNRTTSSKSVISLRPDTCHIPVSPGFIASRLLWC